MLRPYVPPAFSAADSAVFESLVRRDHWVRRAEERVDFPQLRTSLEKYYSRETGCPAVEPVFLLKLELLMYHDNLSDSKVMLRAETDMAYRWFLGLGLKDALPDVSTLRYFRNRLGPEGHKDVFHALLKQAREQGLVRDRLRVKDASHVYANIAVPAGLTLMAQVRNRLLDAADPFAPDSVAGERIRIETIRTSTDGRGEEERLHARVDHVRDILAWVEVLPAPPDADANPSWRKLSEAIRIARKALAGHDQPEAGDKLRSVSDPDARRGRHGEFYDGYSVDVTVDADSQLFTAINVLQANGGDESSDAVELVRQEQSYHGNQIEQLSIDKAGYDGPILRILENELSIEVFVPPKADPHPDRFSPEEFPLREDGASVTCPAGQQSRYSQRDNSRHTTTYRFTKETCTACPLGNNCLSSADTAFGRSVRKNDYSPEYDRVRDRAKTPEYVAVKKEHPLVERKLGLLMNRYGGRRARYRGRFRVFCQQVIAATTANFDRIVRMLDRRAQAAWG